MDTYSRDIISVVIPMYNGERTIERCLNSIINQTYRCNYEVLIINDESTDSSKELVERYIKRNPHFNINIINKKNGGAASARNVGLKIARGLWIALLDCDDEWLPDKTAIQMEILNRNPNIDCIGGNLQKQRTRILGILIDQLSKIQQWHLHIKVYPQTSTVIFKKEIINDVGLYDESLRCYEDGDLWFRIAREKEFWFSPDQVVIYDGGKAGFGEDGLTANLGQMHTANKIILQKLYHGKILSLIQYFFASLYSEIKYIRRKIIVKVKKL